MKKKYQIKHHLHLGKFLCALGFWVSVVFSVNGQARLVIANNTVVNVAGGSSTTPSLLVVDNSATNAITVIGNGSINSEGQYNVLQWNVKNGTGNYVVPFADSLGGALPILMNITTAGSSDGALHFSMYGTGQNNLPLPQGVTSINHANNLIPADGAKLYDRYWFIGSSGYTTKPEGTLGFNYLPPAMSGDLVVGVTAMAAQSHNGAAWVVNQLGTDNLAGLVSGVAFSNTDSNATWTLVENGVPLPITLLRFNAVWNDDRQTYAKVFWSTASEENNNYFEVERSGDGVKWHRIDLVQGAGTSNNILHYQTLDRSPLNGIAYYRLRQVDFDGTATYSQIVTLKRENTGASILVYPNPASNQFEISFKGFKRDLVNMHILDNFGRIVLATNPNVLNNPIQVINATNFPSGVYYIHVISKDESIVEKIVIKN